MNAFFAALGAQVLQVTIVFAIVLALDALVARKGSIALRAALFGAFFVKLFIPPHVTSPLSIARLYEGSAPLPTGPSAVHAVSDTPIVVAAVLAAWGIGFSAVLLLALRRARASRHEWIAGAGPAGASARALLARLAARTGTKRIPELLVREDLDGAATVGCSRPVIVVPARLERSPTDLEHVLLHELGHVRRRDAVRAALWTFASCIYWFHPLVHVAARKAALLREMACDQFAASAAGGGVQAYRRTLLDMARPLVDVRPAATGFAGLGAMITARIERLERASHPPRRFEPTPVLAFTLLCVCCVPLGSRSIDAPRLPALEDVQGCMRKRFLVMAELAQRHETDDAPAND